ncbi:tetratricopeptide repeat protein [Pleurocapsa sp. PCC 7319]|uniref:tetratricopeptide repeat protein n=1 Tax=Pleurocapsa sp. PCC 7319 TaxID=118161 RepID=UPI00034B1557|nr:tetratricopeptide repeat protein [Pleurocapsa sp. PCC 7319]
MANFGWDIYQKNNSQEDNSQKDGSPEENYQQAIAEYDEAIKLNPNLAEAFGNRGFLRFQLGEKQEGLKDLQHAAELFLDEGNVDRYQQTIAFIQMIQS